MLSFQKVRSALQIIIGGQIVAGSYMTYFGDEKWYRKVVMPVCHLFGAERAHLLAVKAGKFGLIPRIKQDDDPRLVSF